MKNFIPVKYLVRPEYTYLAMLSRSELPIYSRLGIYGERVVIY